MDLLPETPQGKALFEELLWVHGAIRRDLETISTLSAEVLAGLPAAEARERIEDLKTAGPLWQLKVNCLRYCRFVHMHHNAEDTLFFPTLRAANPALAPVVDKLEADHRSVSDLLDAVEAAAAALDDEQPTRRLLAERLDALPRSSSPTSTTRSAARGRRSGPWTGTPSRGPRAPRKRARPPAERR